MGRPRGSTNKPKTTRKFSPEVTAGGRNILGRDPQEDIQKKITIKAAVVAALYLGESEPRIASQYGLSHTQVARIKEDFNSVNAIQRRDWLSETLVIYIQQEIKSLMAISIVTSDEEWVMQQNAGDLAIFIATKADKLTQLLQSFGRVANERDQYLEQLEIVTQEVE